MRSHAGKTMHREQSIPFWIKPAAVTSLIAGLCGIAGTRQARIFMQPGDGTAVDQLVQARWITTGVLRSPAES
jgi:hypothetical protein